MQAFGHIRQIDYTVVFARDMNAMRRFYESVLEFPLLRILSERWVEYRVGATTLALTVHGGRFEDRRRPKVRCRCSWPFGSRRTRLPSARRRSRPKASRSSHR
jgi:hypothetical protein